MSDVPSMIHSFMQELMVAESKRQFSSNKRRKQQKSDHIRDTQSRAKPDGSNFKQPTAYGHTNSHTECWISPRGKYVSHNWEFLVGVLVTALSVSIVIALLAKVQVFRRYLASYRHTRLRETDGVGQCEPPAGLEVGFTMHGGRGINPHRMRPVHEEDDDGFIEDNYIPASVRARAARAAENMEDIEDEMDEIEFTIA